MKHLPIIFLFFISACNYVENVVPYNVTYNDHINNQDTISQPLVIPCPEYIHLTDTNFVCLSVSFDLPLSNLEWHWYEDNYLNPYDNLIDLLEDHYSGYTFTLYQSDIGTAVFVEGTINTFQFNGRIIGKDINNSRRTLTAYKNGLYTWGACTYEQQLYEASHRLNIESFSFTYTNYTPEQNNTLARAICHFDLCKAGERIANYAGANGILQTVVDSTVLYGWNNVYQFYDPDLIKA